MKNQTWLSIFTFVLLFVISTVITVTIIDQKLLEEISDNQEKMRILQEEYDALKQDYSTLQQNYTDQQIQFMGIFTPSLETQLGAKVLTDNKAGANYGKNYLWVTGEIYNKGLGVAFNTVLQVKLYTPNSSTPTVSVHSIGDIDVHNYKQIRIPFYSYGEIERWEITANCSKTK